MLFSCVYGEAEWRPPVTETGTTLPLRLAVIVVRHAFIAAGDSDCGILFPEVFGGWPG
jgi:hypothetical protein